MDSSARIHPPVLPTATPTPHAPHMPATGRVGCREARVRPASEGWVRFTNGVHNQLRVRSAFAHTQIMLKVAAHTDEHTIHVLRLLIHKDVAYLHHPIPQALVAARTQEHFQLAQRCKGQLGQAANGLPVPPCLGSEKRKPLMCRSCFFFKIIKSRAYKQKNCFSKF